MTTLTREDIEAMRAERDLLAKAIGEMGVNSGLIRADASLTGPHLLMICEDMVSAGKAAEAALATKDEQIAGLREALDWYAIEANAIARNSCPANPDAIAASVQVLALDAGKRARAALARPTPKEPS
jgi:hypothetical protein